MTQQDAQVLSMCLQRFYLPTDNDSSAAADVGAAERRQLLQTFHDAPHDFKVDRLVDAAFKF